jgi:hypothetical protein
MPWINDEAQFPTPINATLTDGIAFSSLLAIYSLLNHKKLTKQQRQSLILTLNWLLKSREKII